VTLTNSTSKSFGLSSPVWEFPLSDEALVIIARITLMWGRFDSELDQIVRHLYRLSVEEFATNFGGKMTGPKLDSLYAGTSRARCDESRNAISEMVASGRNCISDRNLMTHGSWGWNWNSRERLWYPAAYSINKKNFFYAHQLPGLHERVIKATVAAAKVSHLEFVPEHPYEDRRNRRCLYAAGIHPDDLPGFPAPMPR
jgi:hypothetical protein